MYQMIIKNLEKRKLIFLFSFILLSSLILTFVYKNTSLIKNLNNNKTSFLREEEKRERGRVGAGHQHPAGKEKKKKKGTYPREREAGGSRQKNKREEQKRRTKEREAGRRDKRSAL